jgi:hypothetical protein
LIRKSMPKRSSHGASTGVCQRRSSIDHRHRRVKRRRSANGYARW